MKNNHNSIYKLFYDKLIYKECTSFSYTDIYYYKSKIQEITYEVRRLNKRNYDLYNTKLNRYNLRLKQILNNMYKKDKTIYDYFYQIYKEVRPEATDKESDLPFILSESFYADYKINKNKEYNNLNNLAPRFTSDDNKIIHKRAKITSKLDYLIYLLNDSDYHYIYAKYIDKMKSLSLIKPKELETHYDYILRVTRKLNRVLSLTKYLQNRLIEYGDYDRVVEEFYNAYKINLSDLSKNIEEFYKEVFNNNYNKYFENNKESLNVIVRNDISYDEFVKIKAGLEEEAKKYEEAYKTGNFTEVSLDNSIYGNNFKEELINNYFDNRLYNDLDKYKNVNDYINKSLSLYNAANDIITNIFNRELYLSAHSKRIRNINDVHEAIINIIYDLYDPNNLVDKLDITSKDIKKKVSKLSLEERYKYDSDLLSRKLEYNYHGPIPDKKIIYIKVNDLKKDFILKNYKTELFSMTSTYETRNYDLIKLSESIDISSLVKLYNLIKNHISKHIALSRQTEYYKNLQLYIAKTISLKENNQTEDLKLLYKVVSDYLKESPMF